MENGDLDLLFTLHQWKVLGSDYMDSIGNHVAWMIPSNILYVVGKGSAGIERVLSMNGFSKKKK